MVYTVTFNPSLDYIMELTTFKEGEVNRSDHEMMVPGGKGINVAVVLSNLGIETKALGFKAGFTGEYLESSLKGYGCQTDFINLDDGFTRVNVKVKAKLESEINGQGPMIKENHLEQLYEQLDCLKEHDILVLAGSIPDSLPTDIYEKIMARLAVKKVKVIVDATKDLLLNVLKYQPFLIKPNHHELAEMFNTDIKTEEDIVIYAKKLQTMGALNVLVSRAGEGAILVTADDTVIKREAPKGTVINSVGAGDSMVAGFVAGYLQTKDYQKAFELGIATGSATAFLYWLATKEDVEKLLKNPLTYYGLL